MTVMAESEVFQAPVKLRRSPARHRTRLWYDILNSIMEEERTEGSAKITRVQNQVGLPSDRFRIHLQEMKERGLIHYTSHLTTTEEGRRFARKYGKFATLLAKFNVEQFEPSSLNRKTKALQRSRIVEVGRDNVDLRSKAAAPS
jgi:predicted transcriptional regulator